MEHPHLWLWGGTRQKINAFLLHKLRAWSSESGWVYVFHTQRKAQCGAVRLWAALEEQSRARSCRCYGLRISFSQSWQLHWKHMSYRSVFSDVNPHGETRPAAWEGSLLIKTQRSLLLQQHLWAPGHPLTLPWTAQLQLQLGWLLVTATIYLPGFPVRLLHSHFFSPALTPVTALLRSHFPWCVPQVLFFPFREKTVLEAEATVVVPLAVPCPAPPRPALPSPSGCGALYRAAGVPHKGAPREMVPSLGQDPSCGVAGPRRPKGCSMAFKTQLHRCTTFPGMPRTGGARNTALPGAFVAAATNPAFTDRPTAGTIFALPPAPRLPLCAGSQQPAPAGDCACAAAAALPLSPQAGGEVLQAARLCFLLGFSPCCPRGSGFCSSRPSDVGVEEGGERRRFLWAASFLRPRAGPGSWVGLGLASAAGFVLPEGSPLAPRRGSGSGPCGPRCGSLLCALSGVPLGLWTWVPSEGAPRLSWWAAQPPPRCSAGWGGSGGKSYQWVLIEPWAGESRA